MTLWIFQALLDVCFVGLAISWIAQRRRLVTFEKDLHQILLQLKTLKVLPEAQLPHHAPAANTSNSSMKEKTIGATSNARVHESTASGSHFAAKASNQQYRKALELLEQGVRLSEIARSTGISDSELQLLHKLNPAEKNNRPH
jgi:hypothetical protein